MRTLAIGRCTRRAFLSRSAGVAAGLAALPMLGTGLVPAVASAHNVSGNAARASELYAAMQKNYYLSDSKLYLETSPRARSNPYAYLWPFYEAMAGTIDLYGIPFGTDRNQQNVVDQKAVDDRLAGLRAYWHATHGGYDSYPRSPYGNGGDRFYDDNAWIARALVQLHRMNYTTAPVDTSVSPLGRAQDLFEFIKTGWDSTQGWVYWAQPGSVNPDWNDRGTGPTGGFAKLGLHLSELTGQRDKYLTPATTAYTWVRNNLLAKTGDQAEKLYWDKIVARDGSIDTRFWSYNQGVMIGAGVLLHRLTGTPDYLVQAVTTANAAIQYYDNVGWYTQPVIFNSLFFRNLLLLYAVDPAKYGAFRNAAQTFADKVWNDSKVHNMQKHMIKFEERTSAYKLREQAGMVQIYACLAWVDAGKDLNTLA